MESNKGAGSERTRRIFNRLVDTGIQADRSMEWKGRLEVKGGLSIIGVPVAADRIRALVRFSH